MDLFRAFAASGLSLPISFPPGTITGVAPGTEHAGPGGEDDVWRWILFLAWSPPGMQARSLHAVSQEYDMRVAKEVHQGSDLHNSNTGPIFPARAGVIIQLRCPIQPMELLFVLGCAYHIHHAPHDIAHPPTNRRVCTPSLCKIGKEHHMLPCCTDAPCKAHAHTVAYVHIVAAC